MFWALSDPETNAKVSPHIKHFIALGPVGFIRTLGSGLLDFIMGNAAWFVELEEIFGVNQFLPYTQEKGKKNAIKCEDWSVLC